ncbi:hypothetical protein MASSI9I_90569 [Massilia sp. 9I]|nr:hypothetical protein MASSI9I_90569 [Massilia sp. 9I]
MRLPRDRRRNHHPAQAALAKQHPFFLRLFPRYVHPPYGVDEAKFVALLSSAVRPPGVLLHSFLIRSFNLVANETGLCAQM